MTQPSARLTPAVEALAAALEARAAGCFLCKWIAEDLRMNGVLTKHPKSWGGDAVFPVEGKALHLAVEGLLTEAVEPIFSVIETRMNGLKLPHRWPAGLRDDRP
jgi:hypothetical protein